MAAVVERARAAQPAWEALGYEGRGRILKRAQKWLVEHADEIADTIVAETGKAREDAMLVEVAYGASALGSWPRKRRAGLRMNECGRRTRSSSAAGWSSATAPSASSG